jgi:predicted alpha/beta hydrolase family esterase
MSVVLILPGLNGSGLEHWQTRWQRKLPDARRVEEDDWDQPRCAAWVASLEQAVSRAGPDTVLAAHSLGCLQVAHWAAVTKRSVRGALLVAPPDPEGPSFPDVIQGFRSLPRAPLPFPSLLVASHDDPAGDGLGQRAGRRGLLRSHQRRQWPGRLAVRPGVLATAAGVGALTARAYGQNSRSSVGRVGSGLAV